MRLAQSNKGFNLRFRDRGLTVLRFPASLPPVKIGASTFAASETALAAGLPNPAATLVSVPSVNDGKNNAGAVPMSALAARR